MTFLVGAVRSGKTFVSYFLFMKELLWLIKQEKNKIADFISGDVVIIGKTERTVLRNIINPLIDLVGPKHARYVRGTGELFLFGRRVYVVGASDEEAETKIRGMTVILALVDEGTLIPESCFVQLLARMSPPGAKLILTTNPDSPFHWLKEGYIDRKDELELDVYHFNLDDNATLTAEFKQNLKNEFVGVWYKRFILGLWCMAEGLIYDTFDEVVNVYPNNLIPPQMKFKRRWVSVDYGTGNPTVFLLWGLDFIGNYYVTNEWYYACEGMNLQKTDSEYSQELETFLNECGESGLIDGVPIKQLQIIVDPSAASFIQQLYRDKFRYIIKANNKVIDGIRAVSAAFHERILFLHKDCYYTLKELSNYVWDEKAQKKGEDKPVKRDDHAMDAMRYGFYTLRVPRGKKSKIMGRR